MDAKANARSSVDSNSPLLAKSNNNSSSAATAIGSGNSARHGQANEELKKNLLTKDPVTSILPMKMNNQRMHYVERFYIDMDVLEVDLPPFTYTRVRV
ncbi:hypothetical protein NQ176_g4070 [Zarea fungicola]|uniref:Uncharacterized protein n=1 Tax=Zarea fungicola TaxID=93591 RepID=A0ACC1NHH9_9HYPO|nr:hypothetical protein NQ176_g4070 [Lecanicillium fungicola]